MAFNINLDKLKEKPSDRAKYFSRATVKAQANEYIIQYLRSIHNYKVTDGANTLSVPSLIDAVKKEVERQMWAREQAKRTKRKQARERRQQRQNNNN